MKLAALFATLTLFAPGAVAADTAPVAVAAPTDTQTVLAEGRAAVGSDEAGGALAAKQAAVADALRNAVAKVAGVYVRSGSLTRNFQLVKDEILTRADGYAMLEEIVRTERTGNIVRVVVRARVSTRPLAERLKALRLTRAFRVYVDAPASVNTAELCADLTDAGFPVVASRANAELIVRVSPVYTMTAATPLKTAAGSMTLHGVRADVTVSARRTETGETVASVSASDTAAHIAASSAQTDAATGAVNTLSARLLDALLTLPAQVSEPVQIVVGGVKNAAQYAAIGEAITIGVPGVQRTTGRKFDAATGRAVYEADCLTDANALLPRALETAPALKRWGLRVKAATRARIVAASASR